MRRFTDERPFEVAYEELLRMVESAEPIGKSSLLYVLGMMDELREMEGVEE